MMDMNYTASRIQAGRNELGYTQEDLSSRLGVTAQAVSKWERAVSTPDIDMLLGLSEILGIPIEDLLVDRQRPARNMAAYNIGKSNLRYMSSNDQILVMSFGFGLLQVFSEEAIKTITEIRSDILSSTGVLLPLIRIMDDTCEGKYTCTLRYGEKALWSKSFDSENAVTIIDIVQSVSAALKSQVALFVNRHMVKLLLESLRESVPFTVDGVIPERISLSQMKRILFALVTQGISIRNLARVIDMADDLIDQTSDINEISSHIARELKPCE